MRRKIILITEDGGFAARLAASLERKHPGECEISAFASPEAAEKILRAEKRSGILVAADPAFYGTVAGAGESGGSPGILILSEHPKEAGFPGIPTVYKFAGTEEIYRLFVRESAGKTAAGSAAGGKKGRCALFMPVSGGAGATTVSAAAAACSVSRSGGRSLWLSLDPLRGGGGMPEPSGGGGLTDMIFALLSKHGGDIVSRLEGCVSPDPGGSGAFTAGSAQRPADLDSLGPEEVSLLIMTLSEMFGTVAVDLPAAFGARERALFGICDVIVHVAEEGRDPERLLGEAEMAVRDAEMMSGVPLEGKIRTLINKSRSGERATGGRASAEIIRLGGGPDLYRRVASSSREALEALTGWV